MDNILFTSIELGLIYASAVLGVFLTFKILNFPDLTVDGSFVSGAAATAIAISYGVPGFAALLIGTLAGLMAGLITSFLHNYLKIGKILSGILSLSILYTVNLHLMSGPNVSLLKEIGTISLFNAPMDHYKVIAFLLILVLAVKFTLDWFLQTEIGLTLRATGDNESIAKTFSININQTKTIGIIAANGLVGLAGGILAQFQGFADISMGTGTIVLVLAALMIGEALIKSNKIPMVTMSLILGSIVYQLIVNIALRFGLAGSDLKLVTAMIVIITIVISDNRKRLFSL